MKELIKKSIYHLIGKCMFGSLGRNSYVINPIKILNGRKINIGDYSSIMNGARIEAIDTFGGKIYQPSIHIGNHVDIGQNAHITAASELVIDDGTSIFPDVLITDIIHKYEDINKPPADQGIEVHTTRIGKNCQVGMGARILPGVIIGNCCVIGANAVVTNSIPDYSVAIGVPAKVIKQYNLESNKWENKK